MFERQLFETWYSKYVGYASERDLRFNNSTDTYNSFSINLAWKAWCAAKKEYSLE